MSAGRRLVLALFALAAAALPAQAGEGTAARQIESARTLLAEAEAALGQAGEDDARLAALGLAVQGHEAALGALRIGVRVLAAEERRLRRGLRAERDRLATVLGALQRAAMAPPSALLAYPDGALAAARAAGLMGEIMPELERETTRLGERLDALRRVRSAQEAARAEATDALAGLQALRAEVARAVRRRDPVEAPRRIAALALEAEERARDLDGLAEVLRGAEAAASAGAEPFETRRGALIRPVAGQITGGVGSVDPWGRTGSGVTFTAPAYAQVIAPTDATVRFVDRLIDYGRVVVLEPEPGWLLVLAGLAETTHAPGEPVLAGEPLGTLGGALPTSEEFLLEAGAEAGQITKEQLYVELRRQGEPIDPAPWFANATE